MNKKLIAKEIEELFGKVTKQIIESDTKPDFIVSKEGMITKDGLIPMSELLENEEHECKIPPLDNLIKDNLEDILNINYDENKMTSTKEQAYSHWVEETQKQWGEIFKKYNKVKKEENE